jgi:hypothetical protein
MTASIDQKHPYDRPREEVLRLRRTGLGWEDIKLALKLPPEDWDWCRRVVLGLKK